MRSILMPRIPHQPWFTPILGMALLTLGTGFYTTLTSLTLALQGFSELWIGLISGAYYFGLLIGAYASQFLTMRWGLVRAYGFFTAMLISAILLQSLWLNPYAWALWRMIAGYDLAALFIIIESWLVTGSASSTRGRVLGFYLFIYYIASSFSQLFLRVHTLSLMTLLEVIALLCALSILPISYGQVEAPKIPPKSFLSLSKLWKLSAFGLLISTLSGALLSILYSLFPVYLLEIHCTQSHVAALMLFMILSGALCQTPIGWLADRMHRPLLIFLLMIITALISLGALWLPHDFFTLVLISLILGASTFALYPVSINHVSKSIHPDMTLSAMSMLSVFYSAGAVIGPLIMGVLLSVFGPSLFFESIGILMVILCVLFCCSGISKKIKKQVDFKIK